MPQQAWRTRAERPDDVACVHEINADAFPTSEEAELVDALRADPAWLDGLSIVSVDADDRPVGFALLTRCHVDDAQRR
jgi:predicted N-acetyltransferase YhbS